MNIIKDLNAYSTNANPLGVIFLSKGFHAMCCYRLGYLLAKLKLSPISFILSRIIQILYGIDIHWRAKIGGGCRIFHGYGLVIGERAVIGNNCSLYHGVTIGTKAEWTGAKMPVIGNNVKIYAGAKIIGELKIKDNVVIGANAVVTKDILKPGSYAGIPARKIK
jgi:serine O-acetyltransferase